MFSLIKYIIYIAILTGLIAFFTKPDDTTCTEKAVAQIRSELQDKLTGIKIEGMAGTIADFAIKKSIRIEDKNLYKVIYFDWNNKKRVVGYGLFTGVFITDTPQD